MLQIEQKRRFPIKATVWIVIALGFIAAGAYVAFLAMAPSLPFMYASKPMDVGALAPPKANENRIVIPSINVDIPYGTDGEAALNRGAWWRFPERGNPEKGGNFIIAAHRFSIQPTPQQTVIKSPFYHLNKLKADDPILIDYEGKRYGYKVAKTYGVEKTQTEIEAASEAPKLTIYSCELDGSESGRIVLEATPMGEVQVR